MLRLATKSDINSIKTIENRCFLQPWTESMIEKSMESGCIMVVCCSDDMVIGYAGLYLSGDITNIAVLPEYRGKGFGKKLVMEIINVANKNMIDQIFLEVRESNTIAQKLYESCGFKLISRRKRYYKDGEDALIYAYGGV